MDLGFDTKFVGCKERIFATVGKYEIPLPSSINQNTARCNVSLYFTEMFFTAIGRRVFDVSMEGQVVVKAFYIYEQTKATNTWYTINRTLLVKDGILDIQFTSKINDAKINAIVVRPIYK